MADGEVFRKESKRWVAPKTSYDGDDWGTEYDEYDDYNEYADYLQNGTLTSSPQHASDLTTIGEEEGSGAPAPQPAEESSGLPVSQRRMSQKRKEVPTAPAEAGAGADRKDLHEPLAKFESVAPLSHSKSNSVTSTAEQPAAETQPLREELNVEQTLPAASDNNERPAEPEVATADAANSPNEESGGSLQDIYGFYENRYPQHPYSAMVPGLGANSAQSDDFSDSTASLSTGRRSLESGLQESVYSSGRGGEKSNQTDYQSELNKVPEDHSEAERGPGSPQSPVTDSPEIPESPYVVQKVERLHISKSPGHSRNTSLEDGNTSERPESHIDDDIAEMYQGTSAFLDRPISTYMSQPISSRDISDASIRELLTPQAAQDEFPPVGAANESGVPSLFITEASPEHKKMPDSSIPDATAPKGNFEHDHDYVDAAGDSDDAGEESDDDEMVDVDEQRVEPNDAEQASVNYDDETEQPSAPEKPEVEPFILPSERNRLQATGSTSSGPGEPESTSDSYLETHMSPLSGMSRESEINDAISGHTRDTSHTSGGSAATGAVDSPSSEGMRDSDANSTSNATGATSASEGAAEQGSRELNHTAVAPPPPTTTEMAEKAAPQEEQPGPQSVAAKVKRPPLVDFSALLNKSGGSSESRCEQLRLLRTREAEYSSGLETWLTTTYAQVDKNVKVFIDGVPSKTQTTANHDTHATSAATAKMSSVVHSSASNTKEKLGKVGNKSKSFFAKVMR